MKPVSSSPGTKRFIWDMVVPLAPIVGNEWSTLDRYHAAGHDVISLTVAGDDGGLAKGIHNLAHMRAGIAARADRMLLADSVSAINLARQTGRLAVGLHLEGTECFERDLDVVEIYYRLGVRHTQLAFNQNNVIAGGCAEPGNVGLSRLGRRFVKQLVEVGMVLDLSHTSERSTFEAMEVFSKPCYFSHSNSYTIYPHYRNVKDAQARACAELGGLVGISGSTMYIGPSRTIVDGMFRHIDHFVQLFGPEHVGLGTDYIVDPSPLKAIMAASPEEWPNDDPRSLDDLRYAAPEDLREVIGLMEQHGYNDRAIRLILGENHLRIAEAVWKDPE